MLISMPPVSAVSVFTHEMESALRCLLQPRSHLTVGFLLQHFDERIAQFDIEEVRLLHGEQRAEHEILLHAWQRLVDLSSDPFLTAVEEAQPCDPAVHRKRLSQKIAGRRTRRAVQAPDEIDQGSAVA